MPIKSKRAKMSYDEYDALCEAAASLEPDGAKEWFPTMEDVALIRKERDVTPWLAAIARATEAPPEGADPAVVKALNKLVLDKVDFTEEPTEKRDAKGKVELSCETYQKEYLMIERSSADYGRWVFPKKFMSETIAKDPAPWHFFGLAVLVRNAKSAKAEDRRALKSILKNKFEITSGGKAVTLTKKKLEELELEMKTFSRRRGRWWPTPDEVNAFMRPNVEKCYDFLVWILAQEPGPFTEEERESERALRKLFDDEIAIKGGSEIPWL